MSKKLTVTKSNKKLNDYEKDFEISELEKCDALFITEEYNKYNSHLQIKNVFLKYLEETNEKVNIIEYKNWVSFNNYMYPHKMYYFVFKEEIIKIDDTWFKELPQEIIDNIPIGSSEYPYICDYYKLVDLTTNTINEISSNDENHQYVLYCLQIEKKRLIAIKFEV